MLMSVDGKISTGDTDIMDVDKDYPKIPGLKEGLHQYYDLEQETDLFSLNTGRVFAKIGFNEKDEDPHKSPVSFIVIDNKPHLTSQGLGYLLKKSAKVFVVTTNKNHPAFDIQSKNQDLIVISYDEKINFSDLMKKLKSEHGIDSLTVQSGSTLNAVLLREGLIDRVLLVVAPALIGGKDTPMLIGGESLHTAEDLSVIRPLKLKQAKLLEDSYLLLEYDVVN